MLYQFDEFCLDTARQELRRNGEAIHLEGQCFDLLLLLVQNRNRLLTKDEIFGEIWPKLFVTDSTLSTRIKQIRRALGDDGHAQKYIKTIHRRGFRFVADVSVNEAAPTATITALSPSVASNGGATVGVDTAPSPQRAPIVGDGQPVIAVIPFNLMGTDETHRAIAEAVPTELIATLSRLRWVKVIARGSTFQFSAARFDLEDVRARVGAHYVLSGSVELAGTRLVVVAELADARSHRVIWSEAFSGPLDDVFSVRQRIAREVSSAIELRLSMNEADWLAKVPSENLSAWGHYHVGLRHLYRFNQADNEIAHQHLQQAVALDPHFARAFACLSHTELENRNLGFGPEKAAHHARAIALAEKAADLDPLDPFCNLVLGRAKWIDQDIDQALAFVNRSIDLNPNYAFAHYNSGKLNVIACEGELAANHIRSALTLSPLDPHLQSMLSARAMAAFVEDDAARAVEYADRSLRAPNAHLFVCVIAAIIHTNYGEREKAARAISQVRRLSSQFARGDFLALFTLRDPARNKVFLKALDRLAL